MNKKFKSGLKFLIEFILDVKKIWLRRAQFEPTTQKENLIKTSF